MSSIVGQIPTQAARVRLPARWGNVLSALRSGPLLPAITLTLLLVALAVLVSAGGYAHRAVPRTPSLPSDGPPPRMATAAVSIAC